MTDINAVYPISPQPIVFLEYCPSCGQDIECAITHCRFEFDKVIAEARDCHCPDCGWKGSRRYCWTDEPSAQDWEASEEGEE